MDIQILYDIYLKNPSICTDTRKIKSGDIFWALKGDNFDGNQFIEEALQSGACFAVTEDQSKQVIKNTIIVEDSLKMLQTLALYHRNKIGIPIIVITGTNGKTTTKELIYSVLSQKYKVGCTHGNLNNHIGVPITILGFDKNTEIGVVEAGANHPGEISFLCEIARPNYGIITNIGKAHLGGFGTFQKLVQTKAELYEAINENDNVFVNADNPLLMDLSKNKSRITYGETDDVYFKASFIAADPFVTIRFGEENKHQIESRLIGRYNFENIVAAACIGRYFKVPDNLIIKAIQDYIPQNNRSQIIQKEGATIILDAYNANPSSMSASIDNFNEIEANNKALILGDMFELGEFEESEHSIIVEKLIEFKNNEKNTHIFVAGNAFYDCVHKLNVANNIHAYQNTDQLIKDIMSYSFQKFWILIKGSRGMKMENVVEHLNLA
jgi:UDP-N-acetylmuramoyl-tripeptide--D-alanyl-D-alanine ligase